MTRAHDELSADELRKQGSEELPEREALSTIAGGWMGMATAGAAAAEPSPVDDTYTIQPVHEPGEEGATNESA